MLLLQAVDFVSRRQAEDVGRQARVHHRHAHFHAVRHRRFVHLLEVDVRQNDAGIRVQHLLDRIVCADLLGQLAVALEGVAGRKRGADFGREDPIRRAIRQFGGDETRQTHRRIVARVLAEGAQRAQPASPRQVAGDWMQPVRRAAEQAQPENVRQVGVAGVAAEHFVAAVALQDHLRFAAQLFAEHVQRNVRGIAERFVVAAHQAFHDVRHVSASDADFVVRRAEMLGDRLRRRKFVGVAGGDGIEAHGVGVEVGAVVLGGEGDDGGGIDAAAEEDAHRHVAHQVALHGVFEQRVHVARCRWEIVADRLHIEDRSELPLCHPGIGHGRAMSRQQLADAGEERVRAEGRVEVEVFVESGPTHLGAHLAGRQQRLDLGTEDERAGSRVAEVERLDAETVPGQAEGSALFVPNRQREHALEHRERRLAPFRVGAQGDFGIGAPAKAMSSRFQRLPQRKVVVDFAVVDDGEAPVAAEHRLVAVVGEVDDAEPRVREAQAPARVDAAVVRAAMAKRGRHAFEHGGIDHAFAQVDASDAAHSAESDGAAATIPGRRPRADPFSAGEPRSQRVKAPSAVAPGACRCFFERRTCASLLAGFRMGTRKPPRRPC